MFEPTEQETQVDDPVDFPRAILITKCHQCLASLAVGFDPIVVRLQPATFVTGGAGQEPVGIELNLATQIHPDGSPTVGRESAVRLMVDDEAGGALPKTGVTDHGLRVIRATEGAAGEVLAAGIATRGDGGDFLT